MTEGGDQGRQSGGWGQPGDQYGDQYQDQSFPAAPPAPWTDHSAAGEQPAQPGYGTGQQPAQPGYGTGQQPAQPAYGTGQQPAQPAYGEQPGSTAYGQQPAQPAGQQQYGQQQGQLPYGQQQPAYGQDPNYGQQQPYGQAPTYSEQQAYGNPWGSPPPGYGGRADVDFASWGARAGALLLDALFGLLLVVPAIVVFAIAGANSDTTTNPDGTTEVTNLSGGLIGLAIALGIAAFLVSFWNQGWRAGSKGWSWGKQIVGIKLVNADTRQPPGGGTGLGRILLRNLLGIVPFYTIIDYLFPLWDDKHQTLDDKIVKTYVVRAK